MHKELIERLRNIGRMHEGDSTCADAANEIQRLQREVLQKTSDAQNAAQFYEDAQRELVDLRERVELLEKTLATIANQAHKALEVA